MPLKLIKAALAISICLLGVFFIIGKWKENEEMNCCAGAAGELVIAISGSILLTHSPRA